MAEQDEVNLLVVHACNWLDIERFLFDIGFNIKCRAKRRFYKSSEVLLIT